MQNALSIILLSSLLDTRKNKEKKLKIVVPPQNVVVYNFGAIGDLVVSTAALHAIGTFFPDAKLTLVGNSLWKTILLPSAWPNIKTFIECSSKKHFNHLIIYQANIEQDIWENTGIKQSLAEILKQSDIGINLRTKSIRFALKMMKFHVPVRVGARRSWVGKLFYTHFTKEIRHYFHERDKYINVLSSLNKTFVQDQLDYWSRHGLPKLKNNLNLEKFRQKFGRSFIVINPTASIRDKAWNSENFKKVIESLTIAGHTVVVVGAPHETAWLHECVGDHRAYIFQSNLIFDVYELIAAARLLITNTSSLQFFAASTGTQTITLMGCAKAKVWGPLGRTDILIQEKQPFIEKIWYSRPMNKSKRGKQLEKLAYSRISVQTVLDVIYDTLQQKN